MAIGSFKLPISSGDTEWVRPSDWLAMPTGITSANDTFVGLHAVFPEGQNYVAFLFTTSAGQYQVDWGDGTIDLVDSNVQAQHEYDYATISNSTLTSRGYKQAMITVTPVSGLLRTCTFQRRFTTSPIQNQTYATGFLDCILSMPNANTGQSIIFGSTTVAHRYVERFDIKTIGASTNTNSLFQNCSSLESVPLFNTANVTLMNNMFNGCLALQSVPLFNTTNVTQTENMLASCASLRSVPLFDTQNVTTMAGMFIGCFTLQSVPLFNTIKVTQMPNLFLNCSSLKTVPLFDTQNVTNMSTMFTACISLKLVPLFNTIKVNNIGLMFSNCSSIQHIPAFNTPAITPTAGQDFGGIGQNCTSLDRCEMIFSRNVTITNAQLSRTALVEVFNNLVSRTSTTSATINITGNWGASALTAGERAIATDKNWVITG